MLLHSAIKIKKQSATSIFCCCLIKMDRGLKIIQPSLYLIYGIKVRSLKSQFEGEWSGMRQKKR